MRRLMIATFWATLWLSGCASTPDASYLAPAPIPATQSAATTPVARAKATGTLDDARRHMLRGGAAVEMAKNEADLALAEDEFRRATEIAPAMAEAWFNLGAIQVRMGLYHEAMASYQEYLALAPQAEDAQKVRDEIIKLEFRAEQQTKVTSRAGIWLLDSPLNEHTRYQMNYVDDPVPYRLSVEGGRLILHSIHHDGVRANVGFFGQDYALQAVERTFMLNVKGTSLTGVGKRAAFALDECIVPAEEMEVRGEIDDRNGKITLRYQEQSYQLVQQGTLLLGTTACNGVNTTGTRDVTLTLRGPLPSGGIGAVFNFYEELEVAHDPHPGFDAAAAGLKEDDAILAVNGVKLAGRSDNDIIHLLRGEPGSMVELLVRKDGSRQPITLRFRRGPLPDQNIDNLALPWLH